MRLVQLAITPASGGGKKKRESGQGETVASFVVVEEKIKITWSDT